MKNKGKFSLGWYTFAAVAGLASGLLFSKAQYYKGQADAYEDITEDLEEVIHSTENSLNKIEEESN